MPFITYLKSAGVLFMTMLLSFIYTGRLSAQNDGGGADPIGEVDVNVDMGQDGVWYTNWWIWIIGLAIFIIIIVAIVSAGKKN